MTGSGIDRLTEGQRDCLRLVLQLKQTKEIARELGISPDTVKQRIGIAMRHLGAENRVQAARMLEAHENPAYPREVYTPAALVSGPRPTPEQRSTGDDNHAGTWDDAGSQGSVHPAAPPAADAPPVSSSRETDDVLTLREMTVDMITRLLLGQDRPGSGAGNRLGATQRLILILLIAFGSILSVTGLVAAVHQLVVLRR